MSSCSPTSLIFDSSPKLKPLKASGSLPSFPKEESFESSGTNSSWENILKHLKEIKLPKLSNEEDNTFKASITPKSIDYSKLNFNFPKEESFESSGTIQSWEKIANNFGKIDFGYLKKEEAKSSGSTEFSDSLIPKIDIWKMKNEDKEFKSSGTISSWKKAVENLDKIDHSIFGFKKNSLEASVSPTSFLEEKEEFKTNSNKETPLFGTSEWNKKYKIPEFKPITSFNEKKKENVFDWKKNMVGLNTPTLNLFEKKELEIGSTEWYAERGFKGKLSFSDAQEVKDNYSLWEKDVELFPINKLYGHKTDNPIHLFRKDAKSHFDLPIITIPVGDNYLIDHGVGRSMRAYNQGESSVFGVVKKNKNGEKITYDCLDHLKTNAAFGDENAKIDLNLNNKSEPITKKSFWDKFKDFL